MGYEPGVDPPAPWEEVAISFWEGFSDGFYDYVGKYEGFRQTRKPSCYVVLWPMLACIYIVLLHLRPKWFS